MRLFEADIRVGTAVHLGGLSVFPLIGTRTTAPPYLTGPEAFEAGLLRVAELDPPEVPSLAVTNLADVPVLLVEGEMLIGGDQNRTMNVTVLIPPHETTVVPVSCVEAGRWGSRRTVSGSRSHAPGSLRAAKTANLEPRSNDASQRRSDQHRVWDEIERQSLVHDIHSDTSALNDVQERIVAEMSEQLEQLTVVPGQIGLVCTAGVNVVALDIFDRPSTLECYLRGIVAGHMLDSTFTTPLANPTTAIHRFIADVESAFRDVGPGVGIGEEILLRGHITGVGLSYDDCLVHAAAYPTPE